MATSGNISWELTRNEIISSAYRKIGIPGEGNSLSATQISEAAEALNNVVALAQTDGMPLWKRTTVSLTPSTTNQVYAIPSAVKVAAVYLLDNSGTQYEILNKSLYDFNRLPTDAQGMPVNWTWAPAIQGGSLSLWPLTSDSGTVATKVVNVIYQKEFDGFTSAGETLDFPAYWTPAITYKLAVFLAPEYGVPRDDREQLKGEATEYWNKASGYGDEDGSLYIQPDAAWRR